VGEGLLALAGVGAGADKVGSALLGEPEPIIGFSSHTKRPDVPRVAPEASLSLSGTRRAKVFCRMNSTK
jgi:hypothetical protein